MTERWTFTFKDNDERYDITGDGNDRNEALEDVRNHVAAVGEPLYETFVDTDMNDDGELERQGPWSSGQGEYPYADEIADLTNPYTDENMNDDFYGDDY